MSQIYRYEDYTVGIITTFEFEMTAFRYMLDREHPRLPNKKGDANVYVLGDYNGHNIAVTYLPSTQGKTAAAIAATNLSRTFLSINRWFIIGIGGGVPSSNYDIRLGDVVISMPQGTHGGIIQYDFGKDETDSFKITNGFLTPPPKILGDTAQVMKSNHLLRGNRVDEFVSSMTKKKPELSAYSRPSEKAMPDILYKADYPHVLGQTTCAKCDKKNTVIRANRGPGGSMIHYGLIASGDRVIESGTKRDKIVQNTGSVLCFEVGAAGVATGFPCMVIRGISNYADSHRNRSWEYYAAAAAAAATKEMLSYLKP